MPPQTAPEHRRAEPTQGRSWAVLSVRGLNLRGSAREGIQRRCGWPRNPATFSTSTRCGSLRPALSWCPTAPAIAAHRLAASDFETQWHRKGVCRLDHASTQPPAPLLEQNDGAHGERKPDRDHADDRDELLPGHAASRLEGSPGRGRFRGCREREHFTHFLGRRRAGKRSTHLPTAASRSRPTSMPTMNCLRAIKARRLPSLRLGFSMEARCSCGATSSVLRPASSV